MMTDGGFGEDLKREARDVHWSVLKTLCSHEGFTAIGPPHAAYLFADEKRLIQQKHRMSGFNSMFPMDEDFTQTLVYMWSRGRST